MTELLDRVLDALPKNGHPIRYDDLKKKLPDVDLTELAHTLRNLHGKGLVIIIHGRGWKLVPQKKAKS